MPRLTITLTAERHRALKRLAARRGKTIRELIEERLDLVGTLERAQALVSKARSRAALPESRALKLAVRETRSSRRR